MQPNDSQLALCRIGDQVPGLISSGRQGWRKTRSGDAFHVFMVWPTARADVADLGNFTPTHRGKLNVQVYDELTDLRRQGFACFSRSALLPGRQEASHPIL